ncbi:glutamine-hydrolyzing carbamoyl-phosphate synthase small subunit [Sinimarinibacterium sp. NLF-5-8]|uniref:glutamine-hydrolyzing carbamoyl-phosphate synthase small subunit n=1 Tax=Sinimarinibacterium sp. NLF-5-8 TaxID=2698684 RepID=UPI00137C1EDE|nr:glutamine-hydrolyzing carbamoyl-phosphate synthase small subunit [Sinimarinibacterium sp. NLF-5-8]QHS09542.1 glutamine-hydrolyzing carbamoyl-phosphate synthase small subunit [Sinimarinibacterium sp. NLF-5-8]
MSALKPALLALADGSIFKGVSVGYDGQTVGEVVFNTAMSGYQEIMTDPSYRQQIVTLTYPHIGNVGTNADDAESDRVHIAGLVMREVPRKPSSYRSTEDFRAYLAANKVVAIAEIDTRRLTRLLRTSGAQVGCIVAGDNIDAAQAIAEARAHGGLKGVDLAKVVTTPTPYPWTQGSWSLATNQPAEHPAGEGRFHVVAFDFGVKRNMLRMLVDRGCRVTVVPAQTSAADVLALKPDGVMLSNGPGDPEPCDYAIAMVRELLQRKLPLFGICLGHQILGLAVGAKTMKMKFGHHGTNHPVQNLRTGQVLITAQNHGFAIDESTLPTRVETTHRSLFDGSNQGIRVLDAPAFSFQGHPEASSGPHDVSDLFDQFIDSMAAHA